jgi:hypothetical protein
VPGAGPGQLVSWLAGWLVGWLAGWLIGPVGLGLRYRPGLVAGPLLEGGGRVWGVGLLFEIWIVDASIWRLASVSGSGGVRFPLSGGPGCLGAGVAGWLPV